ncbi:unnamed protein product [Pylaiella littoralis]
MTSVREPAVAGTFYPNDKVALSSLINSFLDPAPTGECPKAIIAPHAGFIYSGLTAGKVYSQVSRGRSDIQRVVLLGPSHRVAFRGMALPTSTTFRTPLGDIPLDQETMIALAEKPQVGYSDAAHAQEHSLEVHLPFLQAVLGNFTLTPIVVGDTPAEAVAEVLSEVWDDSGTLVVVSSDLSHFHDYDKAVAIDEATSRKIENLDATLVGEEACGCRPVNGLLRHLKQSGITLNRVDVRNSGDTAGDRSRVVGYGAWQAGKLIHGADSQGPNLKEHPLADNSNPEWSLAERQTMLHLAREVIRSPLLGEKNFNLNLNHYGAHLNTQRACFVTINMNGNLRGCIGSLTAHRPLIHDVAQNAQAAAFRDPRFKPLTLEEFQHIDLHISILTEPKLLPVTSRDDLLEKLRPGVDGLIIREGSQQATYLPSVWSQLPSTQQFVGELRKKAGLSADGWQSNTEVFTYQTEEFS